VGLEDVNVSGSFSVGGLVSYNSGTITNCYSTGNVSGSSFVGGLVGYSDGTITNCYSTGNVSGSSVVGGLVGYSDGTITDSYWDNETSGQSSSTFGTGKTTAEMKQQATFEGWDFTNIWAIEEGVTYPYLQWQDAAAELLKITSFAPSSPINDTVNTWNTFNVIVNQEVNVSWYLNNSPLFTNISVTEANCTLHAEFVGENNTTPPTLTISSPREGQIYNTSTVSLNVTADETIDTWLYNINGTMNITFTSNTTLSSLPDGDYNVTVFANDSAGNIGSAIVNFTIDTIPPTAPTIDVPANDENLTTATTWVNGTISEDTANVTVYVDGSIKNNSVAVFGTTYNISNVHLGADGVREINVSAKDAAGNVNTTNATVTVAVDAKVPTITIDTPQEGHNYSTSTVALNVSADESIDTWQYSINGTTNVTFTSNTTLSSLPDGDHNVTVFANDSAGNIGSAIVNFTIDTIPPTAPTNLIHTDDAPDGYDNDNSTDISWSESTDVSTVIYRIYRDGVLNDSTESTTYTFTNETEGSHEYNVSAIDSAGNINTTNESVTVIVDYTDPVIHNVSLSDNTTSYNQQIVVSVNVTDTITNITNVTAGSIQLIHQSGMLWNVTITAGYGTNTVTVTAYDNASNTNTSSLSYTGPAAPKDSNGGGGGGGAGGSDEPENVEESAILRIYLSSGSSSTYNFDNVVTSVEVTPDRTYGLVAAKMEVLAGKPGSITTDPPNGVLFKYVNVFVGTSGWSEGKFSSSVINFQVPASWFDENNIDPATVSLYRYHDGEWHPLGTTMTGQAGGNYQYSSPTPGFSTFMILGQTGDSGTGEPVAAADSGTVTDSTPTPEATSTSDKGTPGFGILLGIMGVLMAVYSGRK